MKKKKKTGVYTSTYGDMMFLMKMDEMVVERVSVCGCERMRVEARPPEFN